MLQNVLTFWVFFSNSMACKDISDIMSLIRPMFFSIFKFQNIQGERFNHM